MSPDEDPIFEQLVSDSLARYLCEPGATLETGFRDNDGNRISARLALPDAYAKCRDIKSIWDKRSVLYEVFDILYGQQLTHWERIERYNYDRHIHKALEYFYESDDELLEDPDFLIAVSHSYFLYADYTAAIDMAEAALEKRPDDTKALLALADAKHLIGEHETAHNIYGNILEDVLSDSDKSSISVVELVSYHNELMHSSVYAVALLQDSHVPEEAWMQVEEEFYHCPYFRTMYSFWLIQKGDNLKGIVKLLVTAMEFPWYKEAVLNAHSSILQFRQQANNHSLWQEEILHLEQIIKHYQW